MVGAQRINGLPEDHPIVRKTIYLLTWKIMVDAWLAGMIMYILVRNKEGKLLVYPPIHQRKVVSDLSCIQPTNNP